MLMHLHTHANLSTTMQNGDFEALHDALSAINLSSIVGPNNIDDDWRCWKDLFLAAVKDFMPKRKSRNCFAKVVIIFTTSLTLALDSIPSAHGQF